MSKNVEFNRWRIGLKTFKWWVVLCVFAYPMSSVLQYYLFQLPYPKDILGYALLIVTFLGPVIAGIFYLVENTLDSVDGRSLSKKENKICVLLTIISLLSSILLKFMKISLLF